MKALKIILVLNFLSFIFFANACINLNSVDGNGKVISQIRNVTGFSGIKASTGLNVIISISDIEKVEVKADENIADLITTEVKNGILSITCKENIKKAASKDVIISAKTLMSIKGSAGVNINFQNTVKSDNFIIEGSSGSDIKVSVNCLNLICNSSSGSGIKLSGTSKNLEANASSGSNIKAYELTVDAGILEASSGSDIQINVLKTLSATASSGGDIHYSGNPETIQKNCSSGGGLHKK